MLRYVPRALLAASVALVVAACGGEPAGGPSPEGGAGGRYRVLIPSLQATGGADARAGEQVAGQLRNLVARMETHTAVSERELRGAMRQNNITELDVTAARQLAARINAEGVLAGTIQPGGEGLQAELRYVDVPSGEEIALEATGANPRDLAQAAFTSFQQSIQGIRMAAFCNDYLASQQFDRALENCEQALQIVPQSTLALYGKATALYNLALAEGGTAPAAAEESPEAVIDTAGGAAAAPTMDPAAAARMQEALETYQQVLEIDPNHQDALLGAGVAASRLDRGQEAMTYFNRYLELNPGDIHVRMRVAGESATAGDFATAFGILQPAAADNVDNIEFQQYYAQVATAAGQRVNERDPAAARPFFEAALGSYERVIAERPDSVDANMMMQIMAVYQSLDRTADAIRIGQQATQQFPDNVQLWARYGDILRQSDQHAEAVRAYTQVINTDPGYEGIFIRRAMSQTAAGNRQAALADLERAAQGGDRQQVAQAIFAMASGPLRANNYTEAANLLSMAHQYASGAMRNQISFFWGFSLYRQAEAIARANTQGNVAQARRAIELFQRSIPLVQGSGHEQAGQVVGAARQYIENQEAIIRAARGR
ncbi:MAG TPA: tetratricopeptide repeat protein [Longimicrobiaceae bacterium]|nr:tetratricopeptide repeat protein [Longimicrobiaceae bacterium]